MKLWHIAQWGNAKDNDGNEADTNVIVRANDLQSAVKLAEEAFRWHNEQYLTKDTWDGYVLGQGSVAFLMGEDSKEDTPEMIIIRPWIGHAFNQANYESWYRKYDDNTWITQKEMYQ